jgi:hypothetical protein
VKFKLYNYAEYYTLATMTTDKDGKASLTTGLGDLLIWATIDQAGGEPLFVFDKIDVRKDSALTLRTDHAYNLKNDQAVKVFEMVPPVAGDPKVVATEEEIAANAKRLAYEDSLRNVYTATFPTKDNYKQFMKPNPNLTDEQAWEVIHKSEGNYAEIVKFLDNHMDENSAIAGETEATCIGCVGGFIISWNAFYDYLHSFSDKDLRDITAGWCPPCIQWQMYMAPIGRAASRPVSATRWCAPIERSWHVSRE